MKLTREQYLPFVLVVIDDSLNVQRPDAMTRLARLVVWQHGIETIVIAVQSYLGVSIDDGEAADLATEYMEEVHWIGCPEREPDYII